MWSPSVRAGVQPYVGAIRRASPAGLGAAEDRVTAVNRVVVVTGSARGIGMATVLAFASRGDVVIATVRDPATSGDLKAAVEQASGNVEIVGMDVTDGGS